MARTRHDRPDDEDDPDEEWDGTDDFDGDHYDPDDPETYPDGLYADDGPPTVACPHCSADVLEDAEQCPGCGNYLSREDAPPESRRGPWLMVAILALMAVVIWIVGHR